MNNLKEVNEQIEANKEILNTFPRNNAKNIKACLTQIQEYKQTFTDAQSKLLEEMKKRIEKLEEILLALAEQVTYRLRKYDLLANTVSVQLRTKDFEDKSHQQKLLAPTSSTKEIYAKAKELLVQMFHKPMAIRLIGLRVDNLVEKENMQMSLFSTNENKKQEKYLYDFSIFKCFSLCVQRNN